MQPGRTNTASYSPRFGALLLAAVMAVLVASAADGSSGSAGASKRKIPGNFVFLGSSKSGRCLWGIGIEYPSVPGATSYGITYWDGLYSRIVQAGANVPVAKTAGMTAGMNYFGITGGGGPPPCNTDPTEGGRFTKPPKVVAYFAGKEPETGSIEGVVTDKDGGEVEGVMVKAYDGHTHESAVSGPGGIYYMTVPAGTYRVVPDDPSVKKAAFTPTYGSVTVAKKASATVNFKLDSGLQVALQIDKASVPADGFQIVTGNITTTQFGKPAPGVTVQLAVDATDPAAALTSAPKVAICGPAGRIWPSGSITALDGKAVDVTTDASGRYAFTLTVGTVPGSWSLDAWAKNPDGSLSSDVTDASDTKSLTVSPFASPASPAGFLAELKVLTSTSIGSQINQDPGTFTTLFSQLAAKGSSSGINFGGLTFSVGAGAGGYVVLIAPADAPPTIDSTGTVAASGKAARDLVIDPSEWTGTGLPSTVTNAASLQSVMQAGFLPDIPTFAQWNGGTGLKGWHLAKNTLKDPVSSLQWFGWAYPQTATGYCS